MYEATGLPWHEGLEPSVELGLSKVVKLGVIIAKHKALDKR